MDYKKLFYDQLKAGFIPQLRLAGFQGSGQNFKRIREEVVHTINIQNNKYGGSCCINLGLHLSFLPVAWAHNKTSDLKKIKQVDCEFRKRLAPAGKTDYWWKFKGNGLFGNTSSSIEHLYRTYEDIGSSYFESYSSIESIISALPIEKFEKSEYIDILGGIVPVRGALTMARIYKHLGNRELQRQYALTGLKVLGNAKALKPELESLAK